MSRSDHRFAENQFRTSIGDIMKFVALSSTACLLACAFAITPAAAQPVLNTSLPNVSGAYGAGTATTVTNANGTVTTVTGPGGGANRASAPAAANAWRQVR